jgi:hypothetical protein
VAERILARIPRVGPVVDILSSLSTEQPGAARAFESVGAEILRVVSAYEAVKNNRLARQRNSSPADTIGSIQFRSRKGAD